MELNAANAREYLVRRGLPAPERVTELGGGVSNVVLLAESGGRRMVLKQALARLRVEQEWLSDPGRVFRESAAMARLAPHLAPGSLPEVLFEDRDNRLFAMSAAPADARTWKAMLMEGRTGDGVAARAGELLAAMARATWRSAGWAAEFGDQRVFDELRLDPYYRTTARRHPDLAPAFERLMAESAARRVCLVHGDWSPKNFLVSGGGLTAIDFEVVHFGDPAFDTAFLLNHLVLKSFFRPQHAAVYIAAAAQFWAAYRAGLPEQAEWMEPATLRHLSALMLARVDGKSPVEYLLPDTRAAVRHFARRLIQKPPASISEVFP